MTVTVQEVEHDPVKGSVLLDIDRIQVLDYSPRKHKINDEHVLELMEDFKDQGQLSPILVNSLTMGTVDGHHRVEAAKRLGWKKIRAILRPLSEEECHAYALKLNVFTKTLTEIEEANKIKVLVEKYGWSFEKIGLWFRGKSKTWVSFRMRLANLAANVQTRIENPESNVTPSHGVWISEAPTVALQEDLALYIHKNELSVPETQRIVYELKAKNWKIKRNLKDELDTRVSERDAQIVSAVRSYRTRNLVAPSKVKTGIVDLAKLHICQDTSPSIKLKFSEHLCRSCGAKVNACPTCKGLRPIYDVEVVWLVPEQSFLKSLKKDELFLRKMRKLLKRK